MAGLLAEFICSLGSEREHHLYLFKAELAGTLAAAKVRSTLCRTALSSGPVAWSQLFPGKGVF